MKSLRDVLPMGAETVILRQSQPEDQRIAVTVSGIDVQHFGPLFDNFSEIYGLLTKGDVGLDAATIAKALSGPALNALIAAGAGVLGDKDEEAGIANLALFERVALLAPILRRTMPDGPGPFVDLMTALGIKAAPAADAAAGQDQSASKAPANN